jgi:subtilase family serine protease
LIDNQLADVISDSWGYFPSVEQYGLIEPLHAAFMQAAAEGISVLFGSGDWGDNLLIGGTIAESGYPASDPFVTAVGGTTLAILNATGDKKEWGWSTTISTLGNSAVSSDGTQVAGTTWSPWPPQVQLFWGSGGGLSSLYAQPAYQQGVVPNTLATSTIDSSGNPVTFSSPRRVSPDIALVADLWSSTLLVGMTFTTSSDPVANVGCTPLTSSTEYCEQGIGGGTSIAGPQLAGILALVNQARFAAGKAPVGFANPAMYRLQVGPAGSAAPIFDVLPPETPVASLFNQETSPGVFAGVQLFTINSAPVGTIGPVMEGVDTSLRVTKGFDNVTGLGVPNVPAFVDALGGLP